MIASLLPPCVAAVEAFSDIPGEAVFAGEEASIGRAVEQRRREFITARRCARQALARLGLPPVAILPGPDRAPIWPPGIVGSITHCRKYRAAAVASAGAIAGIGIDAEPNAPLPAGVLDAIALPAEILQLTHLTRVDPSICWDRLLFSAKEAVFKTWFPLTGVQLGFDEAALSIEASAHTFSARLLVPGSRRDGGASLTGLAGRWAAQRGLVITVITEPPPHTGSTGR